MYLAAKQLATPLASHTCTVEYFVQLKKPNNAFLANTK